MSRPQRVDDTTKGQAMRKNQKEKIQEILDSNKPLSIEKRIQLVKDYMREKKIIFNGVVQETIMGRLRIAVHCNGVSYYFNPNAELRKAHESISLQ